MTRRDSNDTLQAEMNGETRQTSVPFEQGQKAEERNIVVSGRW
jgi:hypothetical protein